ncbi:MAG: hypothetical protein RJA19_1704 [Bacteroidota bacterium]|jgi:predicted peptidase
MWGGWSRAGWGLLWVCCSVAVWAQAPRVQAFPEGAPYPFVVATQHDSLLEGGAPILLFLHGRSLSGTQLELVQRYGVIDAMKRGSRVPALVVAPQLKKGESWDPQRVAGLLDWVENRYKTDPDRVYVVGMSLGGYGTMDVAGAYPERFAAAIAICGGGQLKYACGLAQTRLWIQHGTRDVHVPHSESEKMYEAIKACNPEAQCELTLFPQYDHGKIAREFYNPQLYEWLWKHNRESKVVIGEME